MTLEESINETIRQGLNSAIKAQVQMAYNLNKVAYPLDGQIYNTAQTSAWLGINARKLKMILPAQLPYFRIKEKGERLYKGEDIIDFIEARYSPQTGRKYKK